MQATLLAEQPSLNPNSKSPVRINHAEWHYDKYEKGRLHRWICRSDSAADAAHAGNGHFASAIPQSAAARGPLNQDNLLCVSVYQM